MVDQVWEATELSESIWDILVELRAVCIGGCHWGRWSHWLLAFVHEKRPCPPGRCSLQMIAARQIYSILQACSRHGHGSRRLDSRGKQTNASCPSTPSKCGRLKITLVLLLPSIMASLWTFYGLIVSWSVMRQFHMIPQRTLMSKLHLASFAFVEAIFSFGKILENAFEA